MKPIFQQKRADFFACLVLLLLTLALLSRYLFAWPAPLIFPNTDFSYGTDLVRESWSVFRFSADLLQKSGAVALWRPYLLSGAPLIGHPVAPILYPVNWLALLLPLPLAINTMIALHLWWTGVGMYAYLRLRAGLRVEAAFAGALLFSQSPRLFAHIGGGHLEIIEAIAWWPWAWFAFQSAWRLRQLRWMVLLGVALGAQAMVHGNYLGLTLLWLGICTLWEIGRGRLTALRSALIFAIIGWLMAAIVSIGLSLGQIGPLAQLLPYTTRSGLTVTEATNGLDPAFLLNILFRSSIVSPEEYVFLGISTVVLILFGLAAEQRYSERWWAAAALITLILTLGTNFPVPVYPLLIKLIPIFSLFRAPDRWWPYAIFALDILAAWGVQKWLAGSSLRRWFRMAIVGLSALYLLVTLFGTGLPFLYTPQVAVLPILGVLLMTPPTRWKTAALVGLIALDLWGVDVQLIAPQSEAALIKPTPLVTFLKDHLKAEERVLAPYGGLPEAMPVASRIDSADGYDPFILSAYADLMRAASGCAYMGYTVGAPPMRADQVATQACPTLKPQIRILRLLAVRYILLPKPEPGLPGTLVYQDETHWLYQVERPMGRAFGVTKTVPITACSDQLATIDPEREAIVETAHAPERAPIEILSNAQIPNGEVFTVRAEGAGFLIRSEVWAPGWKAQIDGQSAAVERADCALQGLAIPEGEHTVAFVYDPLPYEIGWRAGAATVCGLLIYGGRLAIGAYRRKKAAPPSSD